MRRMGQLIHTGHERKKEMPPELKKAIEDYKLDITKPMTHLYCKLCNWEVWSNETDNAKGILLIDQHLKDSHVS